MGIGTKVLGDDGYGRSAASEVSAALRGARNIVITGGRTAAAAYEHLRDALDGLSETSIFFSDERCVPPDHPASNYGMAARTLLPARRGPRVERMRGEDDPSAEAARYHNVIASVVRDGIDLALLGMGADCHIAALFPNSSALDDGGTLCAAVDRPDGLKGLTLTPRALVAPRRILLLVRGEGKADAVARVVGGAEAPRTCPARLLSEHPAAMMLLDRAAASGLGTGTQAPGS